MGDGDEDNGVVDDVDHVKVLHLCLKLKGLLLFFLLKLLTNLFKKSCPGRSGGWFLFQFSAQE